MIKLGDSLLWFLFVSGTLVDALLQEFCRLLDEGPLLQAQVCLLPETRPAQPVSSAESLQMRGRLLTFCLAKNAK